MDTGEVEVFPQTRERERERERERKQLVKCDKTLKDSVKREEEIESETEFWKFLIARPVGIR